jgi:hypothetical protein
MEICVCEVCASDCPSDVCDHSLSSMSTYPWSIRFDSQKLAAWLWGVQFSNIVILLGFFEVYEA